MHEEIFRAQLAEKLTQSRENARRFADDPFDSTVWNSHTETLESFLARLEEGVSPAALCAEVRAALPALREDCDREADYPTFDWYDEHYHYKRLLGHLHACEALLAL